MTSPSRRAFSAANFQQQLRTAVIGRCLHFFPVTTSTMDEARALMQEAPPGTLVVADYQSKGVGRGDGRIWSSPAYDNLYVTLILHPTSLPDAIRINLGAGVAVARAVRSFGLTQAGVKWPNDVWLDGKKLAGVLTNSDYTLDKKLVMMVGIGINVNESMTSNPNPDVARFAISMSDALRAEIEREALLATLCAEMERLLGQDIDQMLDEYRAMHILDGQPIVVMPRKLEHRADHYDAVCVGIDSTGQLRIRVDGRDKLLSSEEVSIRPRVDDVFSAS